MPNIYHKGAPLKPSETTGANTGQNPFAARNGPGKSKKTVLLVDDDKQIIEILSMMLERLGCRVFSTQNGQQAIDLFKTMKNDIEFVVMDFNLPDMTGQSACMQMKTIHPAIKVILSTGDQFQFIHDPQNKTLFDEILEKPFSFKRLETAVQSVTAC
jgi:CheY-like chemotaxis protein